MQKVILYGAGSNALNGWRLCKYNFEPVCFADRDEPKQGLIFKNTNLKIMSPQDAKKEFPDAKWFITVGSHLLRKEIQEWLISNELASIEDIVNPIASLSLKCTCRLIETTISPLERQDIIFCRGGRFIWIEKMPGVKWAEPEETIDGFLNIRENWLNSLSSLTTTHNSQPHPCFGCALLCEKHWDDDYKIYDVVYSTTDLSLCNFKCSYCYSGKFGDASRCNSDNKHDLKELVEALERRKLISPIWTTLIMSSGEITIDPNRDNLYRLASKYFTHFFSNGSVFSHEIDELLKANKAHLTVSVDAGTEETFCKIKNVNLFSKVCDNLVKYSSEGGNENIDLKYLFIPDVNDNNADFSGFTELCGKVKPRLVIISTDVSSGLTDLRIEYLERLFELVDRLIVAGFNIDMQANVSFSQNEREQLYRLAKEKDVCYLDKLRSILAVGDISD